MQQLRETKSKEPHGNGAGVISIKKELYLQSAIDYSIAFDYNVNGLYSGGNDGTKGIIVKVTEVATGTNTYTSAYLTGTGDNRFTFNFTASNTGAYRITIKAKRSTGTNHNFNNDKFFKVDNITVTHQEITNDLVCTSYSDYRYGMGGQEKVDEISGSGNHYTAEYWEMNPRLAKRWNIDPVVKPWLSGYSTFRNNPIIFADPNGDDDVFTNSKSGKITIIKTKDDFDRNFVDGKQEGENMEQGWGVNTYGEDARMIDLGDDWNREYLYDDDRIIGLAAFRSDIMFDGEEDTETPATQLEVGIVNLGGLEDVSFYQTFYSDFNPDKDDFKGFSLDGNSRGIYPDERVAGTQFKNNTGIPFDFYMGDNPNRRDYFPANMTWKGNTTILNKTNSGKINSLLTLKWGFTVKGYVVGRDDAKTTNSPSQFHLDNKPTGGSINPNNQ